MRPGAFCFGAGTCWRSLGATLSAAETAGDALTAAKPSLFVALMSRPAVFGSLIPIVTLLNAGVGMALPQMMDPRSFGEYALVVTLFNYGLIFDVGISQVIDLKVPAHLGQGRPDLAMNVGAKLIWLRLYIGVATFLVTTAILVALARSGALPFNLAAGILAALAGLADMVALGPACFYRASSARRNYAIAIATLLTGLIVARLGGLMAGGLVGCFAALAVWYVVLAGVFNRRFRPAVDAMPSRREAWSTIVFGLPFFATSFIWAFYVTGNRWIASFLIDPSQFGHFAFSANIFSLLVGAAGGFSAFYYPRIAERISQSAHFEVSAQLMRDLCRLVGAMAVIVAVGMLLAGFLMGLVYPQYLPGVQTARIILVAVPPMVLASWLMPVSLSGGGRPLFEGLVIYPTATVILAVCITLLYHMFGDEGAAAASTIAALPLIGMQLWRLNHMGIIGARHCWTIMAATSLLSAALGILAGVLG